MNPPLCFDCGVRMKRVGGGGNGCLGVFLLMLGVMATLFLPLIGWVAGPLIIVLAIVLMQKKGGVWQCPCCGQIIKSS